MTKTAAELLKELKTDPEYRRKKELQANQIHDLQIKFAKDEAELVKERNDRMKDIGCHFDSV